MRLIRVAAFFIFLLNRGSFVTTFLPASLIIIINQTKRERKGRLEYMYSRIERETIVLNRGYIEEEEGGLTRFHI